MTHNIFQALSFVSLLLLSVAGTNSAWALGGHSGSSSNYYKRHNPGVSSFGIHRHADGHSGEFIINDGPDLSNDPEAEYIAGVWRCKAGRVLATDHCVLCAAGTYAAAGAESCTQAQPGYYVPNAGSATQTICPENTYQPDAGQTECIDVQPGYQPTPQPPAPATDEEICTDTTTPGACGCEATHVADGMGGCKCPTDYVEKDGVCKHDVSCTSNADCGNGEYCKMIGENGNATTGTCQSLGAYADATISGLGDVRKSDEMMSYWAAANWCAAQGVALVEVSDLGCYVSGTNTLVTDQESSAYCCASGKSCASWKDLWSDPTTIKPENVETVNANYSPILIQLRRVLGKGDSGGYDWSWTATEYGAKTLYIYFTYGNVNTFLPRHNEGGHALCLMERDPTVLADCTGKADGTSCSDSDENAICIDQTCNCKYTDQSFDMATYTCENIADTPRCNRLTEKPVICSVNTTTLEPNYICAAKDSTFTGSTNYENCDGTLQCAESASVGGNECCATYECAWGCQSNADCAQGEYCKMTGEGSTITNASCQPLGAYEQATITDLGTVIKSDDMMSQWAAANWCEAQGGSLVEAGDIGCYQSGTSTLVTNQASNAYCCASGKSCGSWNSAGYWQDATTIKPEYEATVNENYSPILVALRKQLGKNDANGYDWAWTSTAYSTTKTLYVHFTYGNLNTHLSPYNEGGHALCKMPGGTTQNCTSYESATGTKEICCDGTKVPMPIMDGLAIEPVCCESNQTVVFEQGAFHCVDYAADCTGKADGISCSNTADPDLICYAGECTCKWTEQRYDLTQNTPENFGVKVCQTMSGDTADCNKLTHKFVECESSGEPYIHNGCVAKDSPYYNILPLEKPSCGWPKCTSYDSDSTCCIEYSCLSNGDCIKEYNNTCIATVCDTATYGSGTQLMEIDVYMTDTKQTAKVCIPYDSIFLNEYVYQCLQSGTGCLLGIDSSTGAGQGFVIPESQSDITDCTGKTDGTVCSNDDENAICISNECTCKYTNQIYDSGFCMTISDGAAHCDKLTKKSVVCTITQTEFAENYQCVDKDSTFTGPTGPTYCDSGYDLTCTATNTETGCCATYECVKAVVTCTKNTQCGDGEYCKMTSAEEGTCQSLGDSASASISGLGTVIKSDDMMNYWSAANWCAAKGKVLIESTDVGCYNGNTLQTNPTSYYCCAQGKSCAQSTWNGYWSDATTIKSESEEYVNENYSPTLIALRKALGKNDANGYDWSWTQTPYDSSKMMYIHFTMGNLNRHLGPSNTGGHALCK
ncbi:MAG: hypothetical protein II942_02335 [Alphaproteobacteria bacterium]|nr:hypothetical protein [Alphaproteobacteria bacterium]